MTINLGLSLLAIMLVTLLVIVVVGLAAVFLLYRARFGGLGDQIRSARYVFEYDNALEFSGIGTKERQRLIDELRANIADGAADGGVGQALERLGSARELARAVTIGRRRPMWPVGAIVAIVTGLAIQATLFVAFDVFLAGAEASGVTHVQAVSQLLPGIVFDYTADSFGVEFGPASWWLWVPVILAFFVGARAWRAFSGKSAKLAANK